MQLRLLPPLMLWALHVHSTVIVANSSSKPCMSLHDNILTSEGCPTDCGSAPCVLYAPFHRENSCAPSNAAGDCRAAREFQLPAEATPCSLTYQCLKSLVNINARWGLSIKQMAVENTTFAPVTRISRLAFPLSSVQSMYGEPLDDL